MNHAETLEFLKYLPVSKPLLLRSSPGKGKTALVHQYAVENKLELIELNPAEMEPTDLVGNPYIENGLTKFAQPWWWPSNSGYKLIFIEEIDRCLEQMFPVLMQLLGSRTAGGRKLARQHRIIAACNGARHAVQDLDQAMVRRFAVVDYSPTVEEWLAWAKTSNINKMIIDYIASVPAALDTPEELIGQRNEPVPCRASWVDVSDWLNNASANKNAEAVQTKNLIPFVGRSAAEDFIAWVGGHNPNYAADIFEGRAKADPTKLLAATHVGGKIASSFMSVNDERRKRVLDFYLDVGDEAFAALFAQLPKEAAPILAKHERASKLVKQLMEFSK